MSRPDQPADRSRRDDAAGVVTGAITSVVTSVVTGVVTGGAAGPDVSGGGAGGSCRVEPTEDAPVVARQHPRQGGVAIAAIALAEGRPLTYQRLPDHCRTSLGGFRRSKDWVLLPTLPRGSSDKVLKRTLRGLDASDSLGAQER